MRVVHIFDPAKGRYPLMINHGLIGHNEIGHKNLVTNADVISMGITIHKGQPEPRALRIALEAADLIFRPSDEHFPEDQLRWFRGAYRDNWAKTILYDFSDSPAIDESARKKCKLYLKRTCPQNIGLARKVYPVPYCVLPEYLRLGPPRLAMTDFEERQHRVYDILYLFHVDILKGRNPNEANRRAVFRALKDAPFVTTGQTTRTGRRDIFLPEENNPFMEYLAMLRMAKGIVHIMPEHGGGDHRIWEALSSGTLVFCERAVSNWDDKLIPGQHYIDISPDSKPDVLKERIGAYLAESMRGVRYQIGQNARDRMKSNHMPVSRIEGVLNVLRFIN